MAVEVFLLVSFLGHRLVQVCYAKELHGEQEMTRRGTRKQRAGKGPQG